MGDNNELIITYGLGYVFKNNKFIGMLKTKDVVKRELGFNINEEIGYLNSSQITFYKDKYIEKIEESLGEKISDIIFLILDIKNKNNQNSNDIILDKYKKNYFTYLRYLREGYKFKDISYIQTYLDKCFNREENNELIKYNRATLKVLLTTSFGEKLSDFIGSFISSSKISDREGIRVEQIKESFNKSKILDVEYKSIDFMLLVKDLVVYEKLECEEYIDYRKVLRLVNKNGNIEEGKYDFKKQIINFLKGKNYLYFTYAKFNKENIITTLDNEKYLYKDSYIYKILCKEGAYLFEPTPVIVEENEFNENEEFGFLLSYSKENVIACAAILDKITNRIKVINKVTDSHVKMLLGMEKYIEV